MQSSSFPSQNQGDKQYNATPYPIGIPHSLIAATMYEGSIRNFQSNPVSNVIMNGLLEEKRADDYNTWIGDRVTKYTACSNMIANEISHLYNRDDLNFDDWQYLMLYNKFKKILTERGTCSPETITFLIYNLINMVKNDMTLRNLLMISSDEYVEEVLTKFVEMALNQRVYGYEFKRSNIDDFKIKSIRKHLQRSTVASSVANSVSKAWGWKDAKPPFPIQAPSQLKPENFYVYGRQLRSNDENINIKDGCIPVPRVVYRQKDFDLNPNSMYPQDAPYVCDPSFGCNPPFVANPNFSFENGFGADFDPNAANPAPQTSSDPVKKKTSSKRFGPRGPYKRTLIRMRMREISRMRHRIKNKANESFFLNSEFDKSVKNLKDESNNSPKSDEQVSKNADAEVNSPPKSNDLVDSNEVNINEPKKSVEPVIEKKAPVGEPKPNPESIVSPDSTCMVTRSKKLASKEVSINSPDKRKLQPSEKVIDPTHVRDVPINNGNIYNYYTHIQEGYLDPNMIYSSNASTNNSISSSPIANDYFDVQSTRFSSETPSEDFNHSEMAYGIPRPIGMYEMANKQFGFFEAPKRDMAMFNVLEPNVLYHAQNRDLIVPDLNNRETQVNPLRKYISDQQYHSKPVPDNLNVKRRSNRITRSTDSIKSVAHLIPSEASKININGLVGVDSNDLNVVRDDHDHIIGGIDKISRIDRIDRVDSIESIDTIDTINSIDPINNIDTLEKKQIDAENIDRSIHSGKKSSGKRNVGVFEEKRVDNESIEKTKDEEHTIWDMVQKHHKSSHIVTPIVVKSSINSNSELSDDKDDMSLLIREHYHISENVPSSQTLPFPNAYKNPKSVKWSYSETKRFYNAIEVFGTDLLLVRAFMPEFTDRQIYDKFKLEERKNPQLMQNALQTHKSISLKQYEQKHGKIDTKTHYNPLTDPLLQGEAITSKSGLQLNPDVTEHFDNDSQPRVDDKIINLFM